MTLKCNKNAHLRQRLCGIFRARKNLFAQISELTVASDRKTPRENTHQPTRTVPTKIRSRWQRSKRILQPPNPLSGIKLSSLTKAREQDGKKPYELPSPFETFQ